jgi:hypothetical protein
MESATTSEFSLNADPLNYPGEASACERRVRSKAKTGRLRKVRAKVVDSASAARPAIQSGLCGLSSSTDGQKKPRRSGRPGLRVHEGTGRTHRAENGCIDAAVSAWREVRRTL